MASLRLADLFWIQILNYTITTPNIVKLVSWLIMTCYVETKFFANKTFHDFVYDYTHYLKSNLEYLEESHFFFLIHFELFPIMTLSNNTQRKNPLICIKKI